MIYIGTDIVQISSFAKQIEDRASVFVMRTFTDRERTYAYNNALGNPGQHLAARYAAKEAVIKAWSSSFFGRPPLLSHVDMREIEVQKDAFERPAIILHGTLLKKMNHPIIQISLSHDGDYAIATALLQEKK